MCCLNSYVVIGHYIFRTCPYGHAQLQLDTWLVSKIHRAYLALSLLIVLHENTKQQRCPQQIYLKRSVPSNKVPHSTHPSGFTHAYQTPKQHLVQV